MVMQCVHLVLLLLLISNTVQKECSIGTKRKFVLQVGCVKWLLGFPSAPLGRLSGLEADLVCNLEAVPNSSEQGVSRYLYATQWY